MFVLAVLNHTKRLVDGKRHGRLNGEIFIHTLNNIEETLRLHTLVVGDEISPTTPIFFVRLHVVHHLDGHV